jgi:shikimate dehydrogenase
MRAAVLGSPIAHSLSPVLHTAAYRELGLTDWTYTAVECDEAGLPALLGSLGPDWAGLSLTMPLKRAVLPLLDWTDELVTEVGAANTVVLADGARSGYNTDIPGIVAALREAGARLPGPVLVLGGGATATSALAALGRSGAAEVSIAVRDPARAGRLLAVAAAAGLRVRLIPFGPGPALTDWLAGQDGQRWTLLLSTVPAGVADGWAGLLASGQLAAATVFDVGYEPWPTSLVAAGQRSGAVTIGGFELLLHQAADQVRLMTGRPAPVPAMRAAGLAELTARSGLRREPGR